MNILVVEAFHVSVSVYFNNKHYSGRPKIICSIMVTISITPKVSLVDETIKTVVTGLKPSSNGEYINKSVD